MKGSVIDEGSALDLLGRLIAIPSVNTQEENTCEKEIAAFVCSFFEETGLCRETSEALPGRPNVLARLPASKGSSPNGSPRRTLLFVAHMDTVSVTGMSDPFDPVFDGRRVYGRGACDDKGALTGMLLAARDLAARGGMENTDALFLATVDEEGMLAGIDHFLESAPRIDAAVVGEPTGLQVITAHNGVLRWLVETRGETTHSSCPGEGVNAIYLMADVLRFIRDEAAPSIASKSHPMIGSPTLIVSKIRGGIATNIVPGECEIVLDRRVIPGEDLDEVWSTFKNEIEERFGVEKVVVHKPFKSNWPLDTPESASIVRTLLDSVKSVTGKVQHPGGVPYGSEAGRLSHHGVPTVVLGPGSIRFAHSLGEFVPLEEVVDYAKVLVEAARRFDCLARC